MFTIRELFAVALFGGFCLFSEAYGCDCTFYAVDALKRVGVKLKTIPNVAINDWHKYPGVYSRGVVQIKDPNDCRTFVHEFYHHFQWEHAGDAKGEAEWWKRERDAAIVTMYADGGGC